MFDLRAARPTGLQAECLDTCARVVCTRAAQNHAARVAARPCPRRYPPRRFSRRRKDRPAPVLLLPRRRRIGRGDHSPLPRESAVSQFSGLAIVETVVRLMAHGNQVPIAPLPAGEVLHRVDVMNSIGGLVSAVTRRLAAFVLVAPKDCVPHPQPALALVVHAKQKRHDLTTEIMALMPSGYHLGCKTKAPNNLPSTRSNHLALALALRRWLWLIFTIDSRRHNLQYSGKSVSVVVGRTRCCVGRPHKGQISLPSADTDSISRALSFCNTFVPPFR